MWWRPLPPPPVECTRLWMAEDCWDDIASAPSTTASGRAAPQGGSQLHRLQTRLFGVLADALAIGTLLLPQPSESIVAAMAVSQDGHGDGDEQRGEHDELTARRLAALQRTVSYEALVSCAQNEATAAALTDPTVLSTLRQWRVVSEYVDGGGAALPVAVAAPVRRRFGETDATPQTRLDVDALRAFVATVGYSTVSTARLFLWQTPILEMDERSSLTEAGGGDATALREAARAANEACVPSIDLRGEWSAAMQEAVAASGALLQDYAARAEVVPTWLHDAIRGAAPLRDCWLACVAVLGERARTRARSPPAGTWEWPAWDGAAPELEDDSYGVEAAAGAAAAAAAPPESEQLWFTVESTLTENAGASQAEGRLAWAPLPTRAHLLVLNLAHDSIAHVRARVASAVISRRNGGAETAIRDMPTEPCSALMREIASAAASAALHVHGVPAEIAESLFPRLLASLVQSPRYAAAVAAAVTLDRAALVSRLPERPRSLERMVHERLPALRCSDGASVPLNARSWELLSMLCISSARGAEAAPSEPPRLPSPTPASAAAAAALLAAVAACLPARLTCTETLDDARSKTKYIRRDAALAVIARAVDDEGIVDEALVAPAPPRLDAEGDAALIAYLTALPSSALRALLGVCSAVKGLTSGKRQRRARVLQTSNVKKASSSLRAATAVFTKARKEGPTDAAQSTVAPTAAASEETAASDEAALLAILTDPCDAGRPTAAAAAPQWGGARRGAAFDELAALKYASMTKMAHACGIAPHAVRAVFVLERNHARHFSRFAYLARGSKRERAPDKATAQPQPTETKRRRLALEQRADRAEGAERADRLAW